MFCDITGLDAFERRLCISLNRHHHLILWIVFILLPILIYIITNSWETACITFFSELLLYSVFTLLWLGLTMKRQEDSSIWIINKMSDEQLEEFTIPLVAKLVFTITKPTEDNPDTNFFLSSSTGRKAIVKLKSHKREVGIRLVQRTFEQMNSQEAAECWVITNKSFTSGAEKFTEANNIRLYDRQQFIKWILTAEKGGKCLN